MTVKVRRTRTRPIYRVQRAIEKSQKEDAAKLRGAIIGRIVTSFPSSDEINKKAKSELPQQTQYERTGHLALAYIYGKELRENHGKTFFNTVQVYSAIDAIGKAAQRTAVIGRGELWIARRKSKVDDGLEHFWLMADAGKGVFSPPHDTQAINMRDEELKIANELFAEKSDVIDGPSRLWLGSIAAPDRAHAMIALEAFEDILPSRLHIGRIALLRPDSSN